MTATRRVCGLCGRVSRSSFHPATKSRSGTSCAWSARLPESTTRESATVTPAARRLRAALAALVMAVHLLATMSAHGQARLDAAGIQACASVARLISDLQSRTVPTAQARLRLTGIYDMARSSSAPSVRQIASMQSGQIASADDTQLLVMAE